MSKRPLRWYHWLSVAVVTGGAAAYLAIQSKMWAPLLTEQELQLRRVAVQQEDQTAFTIPPVQAALYADDNALGNVYFGDLHVHSKLSFDSYIFGNRLGLQDAYRFAQGAAVTSALGEKMQLSSPLDFVALTDHAEGFSMVEQCAAKDKTKLAKRLKRLCGQLDQPDINLFLDLRAAGEQRPPVPVAYSEDDDPSIAISAAQATWGKIVDAAERHNQPGRFTAFAAYEYSPPLPDRGKIHRNVIFRNSQVPPHAVSAYDALTELDLWRSLETNCESPCGFLTIPHNPNKSWGLAFANHTIDGDAYTQDDWRLRDRVEPLVEMFQIKGNSECSLGVGTSDEQCAFEQVLPRCEKGQITGCIFPTSMVRDGLKIGLELEDKTGLNPLDFGMVGSSDTHNSTPGDTEEWDYRGMSSLLSASAQVRLAPGRAGKYRTLHNNPGGLAAVWAPTNTRDAIFDAMQRKETYATSGTRIQLRLFASHAFQAGLADSPSMLETAYRDGVPMGGSLLVSEGTNDTAGEVGEPLTAPALLVWAAQDPLSAPLDRIQIIKGWTENGETHEAVYDVVCSDQRVVDAKSQRCQQTTASVDLNNCRADGDRGAAELKTLWLDPDYRASQNAFYYARVIQNPTCRWSSYDALRLGREPSKRVPATITEMAWSSPIWVRRQ